MDSIRYEYNSSIMYTIIFKMVLSANTIMSILQKSNTYIICLQEIQSDYGISYTKYNNINDSIETKTYLLHEDTGGCYIPFYDTYYNKYYYNTKSIITKPVIQTTKVPQSSKILINKVETNICLLLHDHHD